MWFQSRTSVLFCLLGLAVLTIAACEEVDDQSKMTQAQFAFVNPKPTSRNFVANNARHKILMAVIDSGTDYNHPLILNNIHFTLDSHGEPTGAGYDFIGQDTWPAPYVARTADINPAADISTKTRTALGRTNAQNAQKLFPELSRFFESERNLEQEHSEEAFHGTHVSGLMVYDEPALGLMSFRVLPTNIVMNQFIDKEKVVYENIFRALEMATASGARVINMSLAIVKKRQGGGGTSASSAEDLQKQILRTARLKAFVKKHPDVVFVAAAGNENGWVDGDSVVQLPCGVAEANVLCVGATDAGNKLASFSNIILAGGPYLAAPGVDILSLYPSKMCDDASVEALNNPDQESSFFSYLGLKCKAETGLKLASGTSMASPLAARAIGKVLLDQPLLSGDQAIQKLISSGEKLMLGSLALTRIRFEKPSWYQSTKPASLNLSEEGLNERSRGKKQYFNFYTVTPRAH